MCNFSKYLCKQHVNSIMCAISFKKMALFTSNFHIITNFFMFNYTAFYKYGVGAGKYIRNTSLNRGGAGKLCGIISRCCWIVFWSVFFRYISRWKIFTKINLYYLRKNYKHLLKFRSFIISSFTLPEKLFFWNHRFHFSITYAFKRKILESWI